MSQPTSTIKSPTIVCTAPGCKKHLIAEHMWLPERRALAIANDGKKVFVVDFPRFALCGNHGHLLRKEGVRVYRYSEELERDRRAEEDRAVDALSFKPFAQRFVAQTTPRADAGRQPRRPPVGGDKVGGGLSRFVRSDTPKGQKTPKQEKKPAPTTAPASKPPSPAAPGSDCMM